MHIPKTPLEATDEALEELFALIELQIARNFLQAYTELELSRDEIEPRGYDPRNYVGRYAK